VFRRAGLPVEPWHPGFAVRREWPVNGSHELVGFRVTEPEAGRLAVSPSCPCSPAVPAGVAEPAAVAEEAVAS
jgi:hypothetical protein